MSVALLSNLRLPPQRYRHHWSPQSVHHKNLCPCQHPPLPKCRPLPRQLSRLRTMQTGSRAPRMYYLFRSMARRRRLNGRPCSHPRRSPNASSTTSPVQSIPSTRRDPTKDGGSFCVPYRWARMVIGSDRALITDVIISNGSTQKKENKLLEYCRHIVLVQNPSFSCKLHSIPLALSSFIDPMFNDPRDDADRETKRYRHSDSWDPVLLA